MEEKIVASALLIGGKLYTSATHLGCMIKYQEDPDIDKDTKTIEMAHSEEGFLTSLGRFVSRKDAYPLARAGNQLTDNPFAQDVELNKRFYGGDDPTLDSGLIKEWAELSPRGAAYLVEHGMTVV